MFTGIVETLGTILDIQKDQVTVQCALDSTQKKDINEPSVDSLPFRIGWTMVIGECSSILTDCCVGDSISVNGTCLSVMEFTTSTFKVNMAPETVSRTNLGWLKVGDPVNLERSMRADARWHGHWVQGHVDGIVDLVARKWQEDSLVCTFTLPTGLPWGIVQKGCVCLDGTSLTVSDLTIDTFSVTLVAHTQPRSILALKKPSPSCPTYMSTANIEIDVMAKYIQRALQCTPYFPNPATVAKPQETHPAAENEPQQHPALQLQLPSLGPQ